MDINQLTTKQSHDAGAELRVRGPNGKTTDVYLTVVGLDSAKWRAIQRAQQRKALMSSIDKDASSTDEDNDIAQVLAEATIGWRGIESDGVELAFSVEAVRDLYVNAPYIADQVDRFIAKRANFSIG